MNKNRQFVHNHYIQQRLWSRVKPESDNPADYYICCWLWRGEEKEGDYGKLDFDGRTYLAHRVAYELATGSYVDEEMVVRHRCDTPRCCNPAHLETGTHRDNMLDKRRKKMAFGSQNGSHTKPNRRPRGEKKRKLKTAKAKSPIEDSDQENTRAKKLDAAAVEKILESYHAAEEKHRMAPKLAKAHDVSDATIWNVLRGQTWVHVAPHIPRIEEYGHGMSILSDEQVQAIRATYDAHSKTVPKGLVSAIARHFGRSQQQVWRIVERESRTDVTDNPDLAIPLDELPIKKLNQRGEDHPQSKLTEDSVRQIHRLAASGVPRKEIARDLGITKENVGMILRGQTWKQIFAEFNSQGK